MASRPRPTQMGRLSPAPTSAPVAVHQARVPPPPPGQVRQVVLCRPAIAFHTRRVIAEGDQFRLTFATGGDRREQRFFHGASLSQREVAGFGRPFLGPATRERRPSGHFE